MSALQVFVLGCGECSDSASNDTGVGTPEEALEMDADSSEHADDAGVGDAADRCREAAAGTCDAIPRCFEVQASQLDPQGDCAAPVPVGCTPDELCTNNLEFAQDEDGDCWMFFSGCLPARFDTEPKVKESCQMMMAAAGCY